MGVLIEEKKLPSRPANSSWKNYPQALPVASEGLKLRDGARFATIIYERADLKSLVLWVPPCEIFFLFIRAAFLKVHVISVGVPFPSRVVDDLIVIPWMVITVVGIISPIGDPPWTASNHYGRKECNCHRESQQVFVPLQVTEFVNVSHVLVVLLFTFTSILIFPWIGTSQRKPDSRGWNPVGDLLVSPVERHCTQMTWFFVHLPF
jgi:hypothetical protein